MNALVAAPGVLGAAMTTYVTAADVMKLLGCKENKAYQTIREVNAIAREDGKFPYGRGKANKYLFAEKCGIPVEVVNAVIDKNRESEV